MKKKPAKQYEKKRQAAIVATNGRGKQFEITKWLKHGCNAFDLKRPMSAPMSFWSENDVLEYLLSTS